MLRPGNIVIVVEDGELLKRFDEAQITTIERTHPERKFFYCYSYHKQLGEWMSIENVKQVLKVAATAANSDHLNQK
ncbi:MAG TPA: hypothetical protein DCQ29_02080 [Chitinophagaceae bacterium]|nr:hypothetical protein [Chitinophagaceae bacterium]